MRPDTPGVFTVAERDRMHARILEIARSDEQIVAGAVVGSLATGEGDRWSDIDLTFGISPEVARSRCWTASRRDWPRSSARSISLICLIARPCFGFFCCKAASKSISRLRPFPISALMVRNSNCFSALE